MLHLCVRKNTNSREIRKLRMKIKCLDPLGINGFERTANEVLAASLPESWKGYSSLEMIGRQGKDFEADLVLITDDRIIIVELKNYAGTIYSVDGKWVQQYSDGRQENRRNGVVQARRSAQILSSRLDEKLKGKFRPWVDFCVVLCGKATAKDLPSDEQNCVFTLDVFKGIGDSKNYAKCFGKKKNISRKEDIPNKNITIWDRLFSNNSADFKAKRFSVNNYVQKGNSLFQHKDGLYSEFLCERDNNYDYKALMRRWDFTAECIAENARTPDQRQLIAHRESSVLGYIDNHDEDLKSIHLSLLHLPTDLTSDFVELYEWPNKKERLETFVRKNSNRLTTTAKFDLIQSLVSQLARLHDIDVAHRDLGAHSIWVSLPSKVVLSNFLTATYPDPDSKTVVNVRKILQHGRVDTPEELFDDSTGTVFTRDVYLAIAACHYIAFGTWPKKQDGIYTWEAVENSEVSDAIGSWFDKGLELDSETRYQDLRHALTDLNKLLKNDQDDGEGDLSALSEHISSKNVYSDFDAICLNVEGTYHFLRTNDQSAGIKAWFGVTEVNKTGGINHQLLSFFRRLDLMKASSLSCLPRLVEYGFNPQMQNVFFQYEWVHGETLEESVESLTSDSAVSVAAGLVKSLVSLHSARLYHGDIKPGNIVLNDGLTVFIDFIEYETGSESGYTPAYAPSNFESISPASIDWYSVIKIVNELATEFDLIHLQEYTRLLLDFPEISQTEIDKLDADFEAIVNPDPPVSVEKYPLVHKSFTENVEFVSDDGVYYLSLTPNAGKEKDLLSVTLCGTKQLIKLFVHPEKKFVVGAISNQIRHDQFMRYKRDADLQLVGVVEISKSNADENEKFLNFIEESAVYKNIYIEDEDEHEPEKIKSDKPILKLGKSKSSNLNTRDIWRILVETEHESNPKIQIVTEPQSTEKRQYIFNYTTEDSSLDFDLNSERVIIQCNIRDDLREIGLLRDFGPDTIIYEPRGRYVPQLGETLILEGAQTAASLKKRKKAVSNLVKGKGAIDNLIDYFTPGASMHPSEGTVPTDEDLDFYTEYNDDGEVVFNLNESQREAFKSLYRFGPLALLQGPPGTGKTAFIGSFIHYSIMNGVGKVLLVSQSHEAVNNAAEKARALFNRSDQHLDIVRLGDERTLSLPLEDVGEKALQEHYRDKFRAEYKERIISVVEEIGIDVEFVASVVDFEIYFGHQIDRVISVVKDDEMEFKNVDKRARDTVQKIVGYLHRELGIESQPGDYHLSEIRKHVYELLGSHYEIYSNSLLDKLRNIIYVSNEWLSVMASSQSQFQNFLAKTRTLICGTCVGVGRYHYGIDENTYDLVVIDEAARSAASELAIAMQVGRKVLLVGDHKQLPPHYEDEHIKAARRHLPDVKEESLRCSDFERAFTSEYGERVGQTLVMQYRMAPPIGNMVSHCFYNGELATARGEVRTEFVKIVDSVGGCVTWVDTSSGGKKSYDSKPVGKGVDPHSFVNDYEAEVIIAILNRLYEADKQEKIFVEGDDSKIGVICMYSEQVRLLVRKINSLSWARSLLERRIIKIDTVDSYQGKENDIVILSLVRSNSFGKQGHVSYEGRSNVAVSRAKEALFVVGDKRMWGESNQNTPFGRILNYIELKKSQSYQVVDATKIKSIKK